MSTTKDSNDKKIVTDIRSIVPEGSYRIVTAIPSYRFDSTSWKGKKTFYTIQSVTLGGEIPYRGQVERRYKEFNALYNALWNKYGGDVIPEFLVGRNKLLEDHFTDEFCSARQLLLANWLNKTININDKIQNDELIINFLNLKRSSAGDEALSSPGQGATFGSGNTLTQMFSVTGSEKVQLTEADRQYLPTEQVMGVYRITDDDL